MNRVFGYQTSLKLLKPFWELLPVGINIHTKGKCAVLFFFFLKEAESEANAHHPRPWMLTVIVITVMIWQKFFVACHSLGSFHPLFLCSFWFYFPSFCELLVNKSKIKMNVPHTETLCFFYPSCVFVSFLPHYQPCYRICATLQHSCRLWYRIRVKETLSLGKND